MYIGDVINGLHELIKEIVNNSVDEAMAVDGPNRCNHKKMEAYGSKTMVCIPTDFHPGGKIRC